MSWVQDLSYKGITFHLLGDWCALDGLKLCLSIGRKDIQAMVKDQPDTVIEAIKFFAERAEEAMLAGWASDGVFWYHMRQDHDLDELETIINTVFNSEFSSEKGKELAANEMKWITEQRRKASQRKVKIELTQRRRTDFAKERDRLMLALIERDGYECAECGEIESLSIDHITPLSKGGPDELDNLRLLCKGCNSLKGDSMP